MIANLIDIDEAMAMESLHSADSVCLFYDFAAASPSVEHALLMEYFKALGWPSWLLRFIGVLYANNHCFISMGARFSWVSCCRAVSDKDAPCLHCYFLHLLNLFSVVLPSWFLRPWCVLGPMILQWSLEVGCIDWVIYNVFSHEFAKLSGLALNI